MRSDAVKAAKEQLDKARSRKADADARLVAAKAGAASKAQTASDASEALAAAQASKASKDEALAAAGSDVAAGSRAADAAHAAFEPISSARDAAGAAESALADAKAAERAAADAEQSAADALKQAEKQADDAAAALRKASERADGLSIFGTADARAKAFAEGISDAWVAENERGLVSTVESLRAAYAKAAADKQASLEAYQAMQPELSEKKAAYEAARAAHAKATAELEKAQKGYDDIVAAERAEAETQAKIANAKHAKAPQAADQQATLVQTGDGDLILVIGGVAACSLGAAAISARRKSRTRA